MAITDITPAKAAEGRAKALAVRQERVLARQQKADAVWRVVDETEDLAPATLRAVMALVERAEQAAELMDVDDPLDLQRVAQSAEILHRISRLASNQSTSNVASQKVMTDDERRELLARLRGTAAQQPDVAPGDVPT
jgi:hypothetical protein